MFRPRTPNGCNTSVVRYPSRFPHNDSPLFPRLRRLVLRSGSSLSTNQLWVPLVSQQTLERPILCCCCLTISPLAIVINHFPNLFHLELLRLYCNVVNEPIPPLSQPLWKLTVDEPDTHDDPGILDQLLPRCDDVTIYVFPFEAPPLTRRIIDGVEATAKRLNLKMRLRRDCRAESLSWESLNGTPRFHCWSGQALDTHKLPRALRARGLGR